MGTDLDGVCRAVAECFGTGESFDIKNCSPLTLAYIGDAIFELIVRTYLVTDKERPVQRYHNKCSSIVNAVAQKNFYAKIEPMLTEEEKSVYRRGRNAKAYTVPRHTSPHDYRIATGFEAVCGYLYLTGQMTRLLEIVRHIKEE